MRLALRNTISGSYRRSTDLAMAGSQVVPCLLQVAGRLILGREDQISRAGEFTLRNLLLEGEPLWLRIGSVMK